MRLSNPQKGPSSASTTRSHVSWYGLLSDGWLKRHDHEFACPDAAKTLQCLHGMIEILEWGTRGLLLVRSQTQVPLAVSNLHPTAPGPFTLPMYPVANSMSTADHPSRNAQALVLQPGIFPS